jgi:monoamine oxidase
MSRSLYAQLWRRFTPRGDRPSRREALAAMTAVAAGALLSEGRSLLGVGSRAAAKRVLIIGGGFAGLAAAHELLHAGYDVTVFESRDRVGGRVVSYGDLVKGKVIEGGGEFIGANHPTWASFSKRFNLKFQKVSETKWNRSPVVLNGNALGFVESLGLFLEMKNALPRLNEDARKVNAEQPWDSANARELDRRSVASWITRQKMSDLCRMGMLSHFFGDCGVHPAWQSYLALLAVVKGGGLEKFWTETEVYRCTGGAQRLAEALVGAIGEKRVRVRTPVEAVTIGEKSVEVTVLGGRIWTADEVILAVPPSVWSRIAFDPPLPPELHPQMGRNIKFLVALKKRFWKETGLSPEGMSDGPINETWEATDNQPGEEGVCLACLSGGPSADKVLGWRPKERAANYLEELAKLYPDVGKHVDRTKLVNWASDVWTRGSYSFPAPGQVTTLGPILHRGLGRLHFAGEHTSYAFFGYMEGALHSGVALAKRLAERDGAGR